MTAPARYAPEALLFDLDGVIADVSQSYRRAILETAASYGVAVGVADVTAAKAAGDANNDWVLTHRMVTAQGIDTTLEEVTRRFEALYQGSGETPGLWQVERLLVEPALLERLAQRLPLGIVTGRPRRDAQRFVGQAEIAGFFGAMVCMEDAPRKPDPAPVQLLLHQLGVQRAWLVGDTPDDMQAAAAAGVLPLGVVAPGDTAEETGPALLTSGAKRILTNVAELEQLLDQGESDV